MSDTIRNAIDSLEVGDASGFREGIVSALAQKVADRLEIEKNAIAASIYGEQAAADENEDVADTESDGTNDEDI